jgi:predicted nucleic acid-binding protein
LDNGWLVQQSVEISNEYLDVMEFLDQGKAEVLTLAKQLNAVALFDERRGRKVAIKQGISITGTAAVLIQAKRSGKVALITPLLDILIQCGYRLSPSLVKDVLGMAGE